VSVLLITTLLTACNSTSRVKTSTVTSNKYKLSKNITLPLNTSVSVYIPSNFLKSEFAAGGTIQKPGKALKEATQTIFKNYFSNFVWFDEKSEQQTSLVFKLKPEWKLVAGNMQVTLDYQVFDAQQDIVYEGQIIEKDSFNYAVMDAGFYNSSYKAMLGMLVKFANVKKPTVEKYPSTLTLASFDTTKLIGEKPVSTGTGFYINSQGDVLTAAHVLNNCLVAKIKVGEEFLPTKVSKKSTLLDLAVINTGKATNDYLKLPKNDEIKLGEKVTTVSYPLKGLLETAPNITFGNVTSLKALAGAKGQFQFSAAIQPGSSGGALVSEQSELLGITNSTLNVASLIKDGVIPQNVNFATKAKIIRKFLDKNADKFQFAPTNNKSSSMELALKSTTSIACYQ
jgi:S1-C subfamily serine protease